MVLLHEEDIHFNLIISKDSDFALIGSLSYRHNIGPLIEKKNLKKKKIEKTCLKMMKVKKMIVKM